MIRAREKKREGLGDEESGGCIVVKAERWQRQGGCLRFRMPPFRSGRNLVVHGAVHRANSLFMAQPCGTFTRSTIRFAFLSTLI